MAPELVSLNTLAPAAYNPREADPERLRFLQMSLRKFGFILPLHATGDGDLLSGHQRLSVAREIGYTQVPVIRHTVIPDHIKNVNVLFNVATNDLHPGQTAQTLWAEVDRDDLWAQVESLPDADPAYMPCMDAQPVNLKTTRLHTSLAYNSFAVSTAAKLLEARIAIPLVASESGEIVNGGYRMMAALEFNHRKYIDATAYPVVIVPDATADAIKAMLNLISMRFTLEDQYADQLRWGAHRVGTLTIKQLTQSWRVWVTGRYQTTKEDMRDEAKFWKDFKKVYGTNVVDFGAGQGRNKPLLQRRGVRCQDWEPYAVDWGKEYSGNTLKPCLQKSRAWTDAFLADVARGNRYSAVVGSAIFNSIPFHRDRVYALAVMHALCNFNSILVASGRSAEQKNKDVFDQNTTRVKNAQSSKKENIIMQASIVHLDYEPHVILGAHNDGLKVQKFHTRAEVNKLFSMFFERIETVWVTSKWYVKAKYPKRISPSLLKAALLHEFDLPYPDGESLGRGQAALEVFGARLGIDFSEVEDIE